VLVLALGLVACAPAFPAAPEVADNGDGTVTIAGTGNSYWHIALQPRGGGTTTYPYPDINALQAVYAPPPTRPCVAVQAQSGGSGGGDGDLGNWSNFICATGAPPAFPAAPKVTNNGNGTVTISGTGSSYWHIALQPRGGGTTSYPYPDPPSVKTLYTPPPSTPCVAVEAQSGGTGGGDGQLGSWSGFTCATGVASYPLATAHLSADSKTVTATSVGADAMRFTQSIDATGNGALSQTVPLPTGQNQASFKPIADHPFVDVVPVRNGRDGARLSGGSNGARLKTTPSPPTGRTIIGTNVAGGWGPEAASVNLNGHITWGRTEYGRESTQDEVRQGFRLVQVVGNTSDEQPLTAVDVESYGPMVVAQVRGDPGASLLEAGNEMYLKGQTCDPATYGKLYLRGLNALRAANIQTPYLFNMVGSILDCTNSTPSEWLAGALSANPGLDSAIRANGVTAHPYGRAGQNVDDSFGTAAVNAQENLLLNQLGAIPPVYITEFGYDTCSATPWLGSADSNEDAANAIQAAYPQLLADTDVKGIWYFQTRDYSGDNCWGFLNDDNTIRPQFLVLSSFAVSQGQ